MSLDVSLVMYVIIASGTAVATHRLFGGEA
jgi:hypothetical protein